MSRARVNYKINIWTYWVEKDCNQDHMLIVPHFYLKCTYVVIFSGQYPKKQYDFHIVVGGERGWRTFSEN